MGSKEIKEKQQLKWNGSETLLEIPVSEQGQQL